MPVLSKSSRATQILQELLKKQSKNIILEKLPIQGYELVLKISDPIAGFTAIIAIHDTSLGPALGGIRMYPYPSFNAALNDVLRLSRGMTYKAAATELGSGGGKSVIIGDPKKHKTRELLHTFAEVVESLEGIYICAEDSGISPQDMKVISEKTKYVVGVPSTSTNGDPAPYTAWGTFLGIQSLCKKLFGSKSVKGKKVAIQGLGCVGRYLVHYLTLAGAEVIVADINLATVKEIQKKYPVKVVSKEEILFVPCDILAPCAMGGVLHSKSIPHLQCKAVGGCANNQLADSQNDANLLKKHNILYAPDFVVNAGGLLNVTSEIDPNGYDPKHVIAQIGKIYDRLLTIYEIAEAKDISTQEAVCSLAEHRIKYKLGKRKVAPVFHHSLNLCSH